MKKRILVPVLKYLASLFLILLVCLSALTWWALGDQLPKESTLVVVQEKDAKPAVATGMLKVASYNIGHGQGVKVNPWDHRDKEVTLSHLAKIATAMNEMDADVYLLQEVDLDSSRTSRIDEIKFLQERTGMGYHACALVWQKNYVPFPYWPPSAQIGYVRAANCVLSRYPLENHQRIIFDKPKEQPWWYNLGYIDYALQRVDVVVGDTKIALLNIHMEPWQTNAREDQIRVVNNYLKKVELPIILGGDFNTVLPNAPKKDGFLDDPDADYSQDQTLPLLFTNNPEIKSPILKPSANPSTLYTYPSDDPDRRLDHIYLIGNTLSFADFRVFFEAGVASDHLPVVADIDYRP
jgi:endonuclease/exonuclease/phosphatase family metal-dependent hydrolase